MTILFVRELRRKSLSSTVDPIPSLLPIELKAEALNAQVSVAEHVIVIRCRNLIITASYIYCYFVAQRQ